MDGAHSSTWTVLTPPQGQCSNKDSDLISTEIGEYSPQKHFFGERFGSENKPSYLCIVFINSIVQLKAFHYGNRKNAQGRKSAEFQGG